MLLECSIRNLAVIESVHVQFSNGFLVFTGETGAGKSMLIDALSLVIGGRGSAEFVRHGANKAEIECLFELPPDHPVWKQMDEWGMDANQDEPILIRRELSAQGKSTARINGQLVNMTMLKSVGEWLVNIHGQHEHQSLLKTEHHLSLLDDYADEEMANKKQAYVASYHTYISLQKQLKELEVSGKQDLQMFDLYQFQTNEIEKANLVIGEDEKWEEERDKLANAEKLFESVSGSYEHMNGNGMALEQINDAIQQLETGARYDPDVLGPVLEQLRSSYFQMEDVSFQLRDYKEKIEFNPQKLDRLESRLHLIESLKRKYGDSIEGILAHYGKTKQLLTSIENKDEHIAELKHSIEQEKHKLEQLATELTALRTAVAERLAEAVEGHLQDLQMERTRFRVQIQKSPTYNKDGVDVVEFMISANPGEPLRSLSKIASGGELSRIMLALKSIFAAVDQVPVLIFDEVDTGVSGRAAQAIAEKLAKLASECQVFSITHLPQVACMADKQYLIHKTVTKERTYTKVTLLQQDRIQELARMLGGVEVTETTENHAQEMLDLAIQKKKQWHHLQDINQTGAG